MSDSQPVRIKPSVAKPEPEPEAQADPQPIDKANSQPAPEPETPPETPLEPKPEPDPEPKRLPEPPIKITDIKPRPLPTPRPPGPTANAKFAAFATITVLISASALAALWPVVLSAARQESTKLVGEAARAEAAEAATDFLLATWLNPQNTTAYAGLARTQIAAGQPDSALVSLTRAGQGSEVEQLRVRTLIELDRPDAAADTAAALTTPGRSQEDLLLAVLAYDNADRHEAATVLIPRLSSPEVAQRAARAQAGPLGLAAELYATGLLRSSSAILVKAPTSYERNLLFARIRYAQHTKSALTEAADYLTSANTLNPSNIDARQLLAKVYRELGNTHDAELQTALITKLQSGRP